MSLRKERVTLSVFIILLCCIQTSVEAASVYAIPKQGGSILNVYDVMEGAQEGQQKKRLSNRNHSISFKHLEQIREGGFRIYAAGRGPGNKFCDIHPSISGFTIVDIALWFSKYFPDLTLRKTCIFPHLPKVAGDQTVFHTMLCFCCHAINLSSEGLDTICVSC